MKKEIKIALVAITGIVVLFLGMNFLKGMSMLGNEDVYYAEFDDISGLTTSNPIFANGYQVGIVKDIKFDYSGQGHIIVVFSVDEKLRLPAGTQAEIASDFMGNVKMTLLFPTPDTQHPSPLLAYGDTIRGMQAQGLMARAAAMVPQIEQMLPKLDSILTSLNILMADPAIARSLHNAETVTADLTTSTRQLNTLLSNLNRQVPAMMAKTDVVLDNTQQLTGHLAAVDVEATMAKVDKTLSEVEAITAKLSQPEGSLGLLMNDASLYNRLNGTMLSAEQLLTDIREHPKRYINVSVFGRKEK